MSHVKLYWNQIKVGDIIYVKGNNIPLTIKEKTDISGIKGFEIDTDTEPRSPFSWVHIDSVDESRLSPKYGRGGGRRRKTCKLTKKTRRNNRHYSRRSRRN